MSDQEIRYRNAKMRVEALRKLYVHLTVYVLVNLLLFTINMVTSTRRAHSDLDGARNVPTPCRAPVARAWNRRIPSLIGILPGNELHGALALGCPVPKFKNTIAQPTRALPIFAYCWRKEGNCAMLVLLWQK